MSILGNRVLRTEDPRFLTDGARFVADIDLPGAVHAVFLRSTMAAGAILEIDVAEARTAPGVVGVFTGNDLDLSPYSNDGKEHLERPPLVTVSRPWIPSVVRM